jgi:hypothetical protein
MATQRPEDIPPPTEDRAGDRSGKAGEGTFGRAFMMGNAMFLPAVILLLVGVGVILYFIFR